MRLILRQAESSVGIGLTLGTSESKGKNRLKLTCSAVSVVARSSKPVYRIPYLGNVTYDQYARCKVEDLVKTDVVGYLRIPEPDLINSFNKQIFGASPNVRSTAYYEYPCAHNRVQGYNLPSAVRRIGNGYAFASSSGNWIFNGAVYTQEPAETYLREGVSLGSVRFVFGNMQVDKVEKDGDDLIAYLSLSDMFGRGRLSWTSEDELVTELYEEDGEIKGRGERITVTAEIWGDHWE